MANIHGHNVAVQQAAVIAKGGGRSSGGGNCMLLTNLGSDQPLSSGRLPQGGIVATEGKKKASPLAPRRKSVPEGRGMQGGALRAFATPSEAPPCGFRAKPQGEKEKRKKLFFCVSLSRFPGLAARRKRKEEKTSLCPSPFSHKKRSGFFTASSHSLAQGPA